MNRNEHNRQLRKVVLLIAATFVWVLGSSSWVLSKELEPPSQDLKSVQLEPGVFDVPLILSPSLESRRSEFRDDFIEAQKRVRAFATKNGWASLTDSPFIKRAEIYDSKARYDECVRKVSPEMQGKPIPRTFSALIDQNIFFAVSPAIYNENFPAGRETDSYIKLITHELAHRLHVRIVNGDEEKMGPIWFFEGFAVYAADQFAPNTPELSESEISSIVNAKFRGEYREYKVVFTHFLQGVTLQDYVKRAGQPEFIVWLKTKG